MLTAAEAREIASAAPRKRLKQAVEKELAALEEAVAYAAAHGKPNTCHWFQTSEQDVKDAVLERLGSLGYSTRSYDGCKSIVVEWEWRK